MHRVGFYMSHTVNFIGYIGLDSVQNIGWDTIFMIRYIGLDSLRDI